MLHFTVTGQGRTFNLHPSMYIGIGKPDQPPLAPPCLVSLHSHLWNSSQFGHHFLAAPTTSLTASLCLYNISKVSNFVFFLWSTTYSGSFTVCLMMDTSPNLDVCFQTCQGTFYKNTFNTRGSYVSKKGSDLGQANFQSHCGATMQ